MFTQPIKIVALIISILAHLFSYLQFELMGEKLILYQRINSQFRILLLLSLGLAIFLFFIKKTGYLWLIFFFRGVIFYLISVPVNGYIGINLTLITSLIFEVFAYTSIYAGLFYSFFLVGLSLFLQQTDGISAYSVILSPTPFHDSLSFSGYALIIISLSALLLYRQDNLVSFSDLNQQLNDTTIQLAEANIQLQEYAMRAESEAAKKERKIVAREVHDSLAYTLTNIIMMIEAGIAMTENYDSCIATHLKKIRNQAQDGLYEVRQALKIIRAPLSTEITGLRAIKRLVDSFMGATKIEIQLSFGNVSSKNFNQRVHKTVYRLVQEGLTNAIRHGKASMIKIIFSVMNDWLNVWIEDNGIGCEIISIGYGLMGMRERIEGMGGRLEAKSEIGRGYILSAWIPLKEVGNNGEN